MEDLLKIIGGIALFIAVMLFATFAMPFVGLKFYEWFVLPVVDLPKFTLLHFVGFRLFTSVMFPYTSVSIKKEYKEDAYGLSVFLVPLITLAFGWAVHNFFPL